MYWYHYQTARSIPADLTPQSLIKKVQNLAERVKKKEIASLRQTRPIIADNLLRQKMLAIRPTGLLALFKKINI